MSKRRHRGNIRRIRQRNRRVALTVAVMCLICMAAVFYFDKKDEEKLSREVYVENQKAVENGENGTVQGGNEDNSSNADGDAADSENKKEESGLVLAEDSEKSKWYLKLVNADHSMTQEDVPDVTEVPVDSNGYQVDARIVDAVVQMFEDARAEGLNPMICSAFRAWDTQVSLYENKISRVMNEEGLSQEDAAVEAATVVAKPGTSEHQIGLALDIVSYDYQELDDEQMNTPEQKWLMENCWKYGFILRYPVNKSEITGVIFEPWHYRYVGEKAAKEITEQDITLEEYLGAAAVETTVFSTDGQE